MPYISCQGNYDNSSAFSLIYKIRLDEDKVVKITFWDYEEEFRITDSNYDEILLVLEILLTIKENNLLQLYFTVFAASLCERSKKHYRSEMRR